MSEVEAVVDYIKRTGSPDYSEEVMEHIVTLRVPLIAQVSQGKDWEAAH